MPSHRKRPAPQPSRRPQVAGLRKPGAKPSPRPRPTPYSAQHDDIVEEPNGAGQLSDEQPLDEVEQVAAEPVDATDEEIELEADVADDAEATAVEGEQIDDGAEQASPRLAPRAKARDTGQVKPESGVVADDAAEPSAIAAESSGAKRDDASRTKAIVSMAAVLALVFALIAGFFAYKLIGVYSTTNNEAISDAVGTEQVQNDVTSAVETLLSYDYNKIDEHEKAARSLLITDEVRGEFDKLYGDVKKKAPEQKIVLVTKVSYSSVLELDDDTAKVLLFVEQSASRQGTEQKSSGGGQLTVDAQLQDGEWRLAGINTYGPIQAPAGGEKKPGN